MTTSSLPSLVVDEVAIDDLRPDPANPRRISEEELDVRGPPWRPLSIGSRTVTSTLPIPERVQTQIDTPGPQSIPLDVDSARSLLYGDFLSSPYLVTGGHRMGATGAGAAGARWRGLGGARPR
jgi:hypothetical protein